MSRGGLIFNNFDLFRVSNVAFIHINQNNHFFNLIKGHEPPSSPPLKILCLRGEFKIFYEWFMVFKMTAWIKLRQQKKKEEKKYVDGARVILAVWTKFDVFFNFGLNI